MSRAYVIGGFSRQDKGETKLLCAILLALLSARPQQQHAPLRGGLVITASFYHAVLT